jgi:hypothetical protein
MNISICEIFILLYFIFRFYLAFSFSPERSVGENEFCGNEVEAKLTFLAEALPEPKMNFSKCNVEKLVFLYASLRGIP